MHGFSKIPFQVNIRPTTAYVVCSIFSLLMNYGYWSPLVLNVYMYICNIAEKDVNFGASTSICPYQRMQGILY